MGRVACRGALAFAAILCAAAPAWGRATRWHLDVDAAYLRGSLRYFDLPVPVPQCEGGCTIPRIDSLHVARTGVGLGYGILTLEGSVSFPVKYRSPYLAWSAGFRVETSSEAPIALAFRFAYLETTINNVAGRGGRGGLSFLIRFHPGVVVYAEGTIEAHSVPRSVQAYGTYLSYASMVGCGMRMSLR
jgi:hypothetical protein